MPLPYVNISPTAFYIGSFPVRWYALSYVAGFLGGNFLLKSLLKNFRIKRRHSFIEHTHVEDLLSYIAPATIIGGRLGYVFFYRPSYYLEDWHRIYRVWEGGMSFHGGIVGAAIGMLLFARKNKLSLLAISDAVCTVAPLGLFFGRIANFINGELYGRPTDMPWGLRFLLNRELESYTDPVHPTQLYEASLEGLLLLSIGLFLVIKKRAWQQQGYITAIFLIGYACARSFCELWRQPDVFLGFILPMGNGGITQGMILSAPMLLLGLALLTRAQRS